MTVAGLIAVAALTACSPPQSALQQIRARGSLRVITLNAPTTYYLGAHGPEGLEYSLASAFARALGVSLKIETASDQAALRRAVQQGYADVAAAQITADAGWRTAGLATDQYDEIAQLVVQKRGRSRPRDVTSLAGARIAVRADSPQLALLRTLRARAVPKLSWQEVPPDQAEPLDFVDGGGADYAVVDATEFAFAQHLYPDVEVAFVLPDPRPAQWMVGPKATDLQQAANRFFAGLQESGELIRVEQLAISTAHDFDYEDAHRFQSDVATRLPELQSMFQSAAQATGLDWRLLAAVGYQESKWQNDASSADGAQGIMMLTTDAATTVGVDDRSNQWQNILGGARYLAQVIDTIPHRIPEPDRTWLALAAYNVGYGHLEDARVLAQKRGKNPDSWEDVRAQLPLLADEQWYSHAKRGYARGWEPAKFVEQVRQYLAVLEWIGASEVAQARALPVGPAATLQATN